MSYDRIRVYITPLHYEGVYGDIVDVTKNIDVTSLVRDNIGTIKSEIDNGDYDFGLFTFGSITLSCFNDQGLFSQEQDPRSIFTYKRDLAQVRLAYSSPGHPEIDLFEGLINEDTVRDQDIPEDDLKSSIVKFKVLSLDSVFRHVQVAGGTIATGVTISAAIKQILNTTQITSILNYDEAKITVTNDVVIDDGDYFSALTTNEALNDLLLAANSILYIDKNKNIIVTPRIENTKEFFLFAPHDPLNRGNIMEIKNYNSGVQRAFSAIEVNETEVIHEPSIEGYGYRPKSISLDFISNSESLDIIANSLLDEFKTPRLECEVKVPFSDVPQVELLDKVRIDYPFRITPPSNQDVITTINTMSVEGSLINNATGSVKISPAIVWKTIAVTHNIKNFTTQLKLRQVGNDYGQGVAE